MRKVSPEIYYRGVPGERYGIWSVENKGWFDEISEDTPMLAMARLYQKIGVFAKRNRYEPRPLPHKTAVHTKSI